MKSHYWTAVLFFIDILKITLTSKLLQMLRQQILNVMRYWAWYFHIRVFASKNEYHSLTYTSDISDVLEDGNHAALVKQPEHCY